MSALVLALALFWLLVASYELWAICRLPDLPPLPALPASSANPTELPRTTIVLAVRNDADQIEASIRSLLTQQEVNLGIVAVDDRSTDATPEILTRLAAMEPRLQIVTIDQLPAGWLGKTHALQRGAEHADGDWILFTDGDAELSRTTVARAIHAAEATNADHVSLLPNHRQTSLLGESCLLAFQLVVQRRIRAVNATRQRSFVGTGAFNLVRTTAYRSIGGHRNLQLEVVDDVFLGARLFRHGFRSRVWFAGDDFAIDWGNTPRQLVRVVEKNMFAMLRYRTALAISGIFLTVALLLLTWTAPLLSPAGWWPVLTFACSCIPALLLARRLHWRPLAALLMPWMRCWLPLALWNSTWATLRRRGVQWRGNFYSLAELRAARDQWQRE